MAKDTTELKLSVAGSTVFAAIFSFFSDTRLTEVFETFFYGILRYSVFIGAAVIDWAKAGHAIYDAWKAFDSKHPNFKDRYKKVAKAVFETLSALAVTAAVIAALVFSAAFVPLMFTLIVGVKAAVHLIAGLGYLGMAVFSLGEKGDQAKAYLKQAGSHLFSGILLGLLLFL